MQPRDTLWVIMAIAISAGSTARAEHDGPALAAVVERAPRSERQSSPRASPSTADAPTLSQLASLADGKTEDCDEAQKAAMACDANASHTAAEEKECEAAKAAAWECAEKRRSTIEEAAERHCGNKESEAKACAVNEATASEAARKECDAKKAAASQCRTALDSAKDQRARAEAKADLERHVASLKTAVPGIYGRKHKLWFQANTCKSIKVADVDRVGIGHLPRLRPLDPSRARVAATPPPDKNDYNMLRAPGPDDPRWLLAATPGRVVMSSKTWCDDSLTICWDPCKARFGGVRFIAEPRFGTVFAAGDDRPKQDAFGSLALVGLETTAWGGYVAFQVQVVTPGTVTLEETSPLRKEMRLRQPDGTPNTDGTIHVRGGLGLGFSFFDGVFAVGVGYITLDKRDIEQTFAKDYGNRKGYIYLNFQPISTLRAGLKRTKD